MSETQTCLQCNDTFKQEDKELFCCDTCRFKFWKNRAKTKKKIDTLDDLDDLRLVIERTRADARNMVRSINRIQNDYENWEDRVNAIEAHIYELEVEVGKEEKELSNSLVHKAPQDLNFDALDIFNDIDLEAKVDDS